MISKDTTKVSLMLIQPYSHQAYQGSYNDFNPILSGVFWLLILDWGRVNLPHF